MAQIGIWNDVPKSLIHSLIQPGVIECLLWAHQNKVTFVHYTLK